MTTGICFSVTLEIGFGTMEIQQKDWDRDWNIRQKVGWEMEFNTPLLILQEGKNARL